MIILILTNSIHHMLKAEIRVMQFLMKKNYSQILIETIPHQYNPFRIKIIIYQIRNKLIVIHQVLKLEIKVL